MVQPETQTTDRPKVKLLPYIASAVGIIVFVLAMYTALSDLKGRGRGQELQEGEPLVSIWIPIISIPLGILVVAFFYRRNVQLVRDGVEVLAEVTGAGRIVTKGLRDLSFQYEYNGSTRKKRKSMNVKDVGKLQVGDRFRILVDPKNTQRYYVVSTHAVPASEQ